MSKTNLEKRKENRRNTIVFWITVLGFVGGIIFWLYDYQIDNIKEKHQTEIKELETKISSIQRNIGKNEYFDIKNLFVSENDRNKPAIESNYLPSGNFYADTTETQWNYREIPPISFIRNELDIDPLEFQIGRKNSITLDSILSSPEFKSYRREYKFHQWKYKDSIIWEYGQNKEVLNSTINVLVIDKGVAKIAFDIIKRNLKSETALLNSFDVDTTMVDQVVKTAKRQYSRNSSALLFNIFINGTVYNSLLNGELMELKNVQKKSDVFYTKYTSEIESNPKPIFETGELFFAEKNNLIYIILIKIYDNEPLMTTKKASDINKWLFSLKFL